MLGVVIEGEPHPPITHIGPAVRASDHASEYLVQGIISASAGETFLKNYRPDLGDILRRIEVRISRIHFIHYRAGAWMGLSAWDCLPMPLLAPWPGPRSAPGGFSLSGTLRQLISARPCSSTKIAVRGTPAGSFFNSRLSTEVLLSVAPFPSV